MSRAGGSRLPRRWGVADAGERERARPFLLFFFFSVLLPRRRRERMSEGTGRRAGVPALGGRRAGGVPGEVPALASDVGRRDPELVGGSWRRRRVLVSHRILTCTREPEPIPQALLGRVGEASRRAGPNPLPVSFGAAWGGPVFRHGRAPLGGRCPRTPACTCACGLSAASRGKGSCLPSPFLLSPPPLFPSIDEMRRVASEGAPGGPAVPRSPSHGSCGGARCSGTGGPLSGSLPAAIGEARRSPARAEGGGGFEGSQPGRAGSAVRPPSVEGRARPTESSRVVAERPREPQAYVPSSLSEAPAPASVRGPSGGRPRAASRRGGNRGKPLGSCEPSTETQREKARERQERGAAPESPGRGDRGRPPVPPPLSGRRSPRRFSCRVPARCGARRPGRGPPSGGPRLSRGRVLL